MLGETAFTLAPVEVPASTVASPTTRIFLKDVYFARIGPRLFFWRIVRRRYVGPMLEWIGYHENQIEILCFRREADARMVAALQKRQRPKRAAKRDNVPDQLIERFMKWRWAYIESR